MLTEAVPRDSTAVLTRLRPLMLEAAALAVLLAAAAWIFAIPLHDATNYDEGNYLAALTDLRHGFALGKDVYADQPPGWYLLLQLLAWLFGNSLTGIRTGLLVIALIGVVAAWACGRRLGPLPALGAAAVLVVAPPYPIQAAQIEADTSAAVFALVALAFAAWAHREQTVPVLATLAGAFFAFAVSVKLSALTALLPLAAIVLLPRRRQLRWPLLGMLAVVGVEVLLYRNELGPIAHGAVGQHTSALGSSRWSRSANVHRLLHFLNWHTPLAWLVLAAAIGSVWLARRSGFRLLGALWLWVPAAAAVVLAMKPLLDHHLVILAVAIAVPAGAALGLTVSRLGPRETRAALALFIVAFLAAGVYQQHRQLVRAKRAEPSFIFWAANRIRAATTPREVIATDIPIIAYDAHRRLVPDLVDTSFTRIGVGDLTSSKIFADIDRYHVRVAAVGRAFYADPRIRHRFDVEFRRRIVHPDIVLYFGRRNP
jgi:4-amino-4-deoxy-L-arabinose transferase-like glycosyltransferase